MEPPAAAPRAARASLEIIDPNGRRTRAAIEPLPFSIGRSPESSLIIRDGRISRMHARILLENGEYVVEDCGSRHGAYVNGQRISRRALRDSDRIEFGVQDSYALVFWLDGAELKRLMEQMASAGGAPAGTALRGVGGNLAKLKAVLDLARTMQTAFSVNDVLASVVDTALAVTGAERGFLLLRSGDALETRVARGNDGQPLADSDLRIPREVLRRALERRRELLHMDFDPLSGDQTRAGGSIADLELRSVICVPLVRIRTEAGDATSMLSTGGETVGVLYLDSRVAAADLAGGNRELIQTLAIEASTILENARLLEEEQGKRRLEEELRLARQIQQSLLPGRLPTGGWLAAAGSSVASREVGGDYFDVTEVTPDCWSAVVADVSGKGVSSALLASLLEGALMAATDAPAALARRVGRLNRFLLERTGGEKYATVFYCLLHRDGRLSYVNAAHCAPLVVRAGNVHAALEATELGVGGGSRVLPGRGAPRRRRQAGDLHRWNHGSPEYRGRVLRQKKAEGNRHAPCGGAVRGHARRHSGRGGLLHRGSGAIG
ncbi:MAG: FHA domain-containing protein [Acidobacteriia bacterium]|nr:FHA domain-containing protein [Terriglobia bacterium]